MGEIKVVTDANFAEEVLMSDKPVLVDFWAEWCGPCKKIGPILQEIAAEQDSLIIAKMNVDENPSTPSTYGITSIPTLNVYQGGQIVKTIIGAKPKAALVADLQPYL
jgi:thioredoxin 1